MVNLATAKLRPQTYGIAMAQNSFGGPRGIWVECQSCSRSDVIAGSGSSEWAAVSDEDATGVFRRHGWRGIGRKPRCPDCIKRGRK